MGFAGRQNEKNETPFNAAVRERHEEIGSQHSVQLKKDLGAYKRFFLWWEL